MTMHLAPVYYTTTNYKKRKNRKLSDNQRQKLETEWRQYNKRMRQMNCHSAQFDELEDYIAYTQGRYKSKAKDNSNDCKPLVQKSTEPYRRQTPDVPSLSKTGICGFAPRKESPKYTGDLIVGIGTMHKSNAVPIMRGTKQAEEIAKMRR